MFFSADPEWIKKILQAPCMLCDSPLMENWQTSPLPFPHPYFANNKSELLKLSFVLIKLCCCFCITLDEYAKVQIKPFCYSIEVLLKPEAPNLMEKLLLCL